MGPRTRPPLHRIASLIGTVAAALLLGIVSNALNLLQISAFVQILIKGLIVIGAIVINQPSEEWR